MKQTANMTLDEAILHAEEIAEKCESYENQSGYECFTQKRRECAAEHKQLVEWLKELKRYKEREEDDVK